MQNKKSAIYANGVVSSLSKDFLSQDTLKKLAESKTITDFYSLLQENPFFGGFNFEENDLEEILRSALTDLCNFVKKESPDFAFSKIFLLPIDYQNVYSFLNCQLSQDNFEDHVDTEGNYILSQIKEFVVSQRLDNFNDEFLKNSVLFYEKLKEETPIDYHEIDNYFKQQMYKDMLRFSAKNGILKRIVKTKIDIENISCVMRSKSQFELEGLYIEGGVLSKGDIKNVFLKNKIELDSPDRLYLKKFLKCAYDDKKTNAYVNFEKMKNLVEIDILKDYVSQVESSALFMIFCYKKLVEIKNLRLISSCIKNNLGDRVSKRLLWEG